MSKNIQQLSEEIEKLNREKKELQQRLLEADVSGAKASFDAIREGKIDALVVADKKDLKIYTERTADKTYRILIEQMHEGAVTLNEDGTILYANSSFAKMVNQPLQKIPGAKFEKFIDGSSKGNFNTLFIQGWKAHSQDEISLNADDRAAIPVLMSVNTLLWDNHPVLSIILTDLTIQKRNQEELKRRTKQLELANAELETANKNLTGLAYVASHENKEKEKRAAELGIANKELSFQNREKEKRALELIIANKELLFQNEEKGKRAVELIIANKELLAFNYIASHDLVEPLRKIQVFATIILEKESENLSVKGKDYFRRMQTAAARMQQLIDDLLSYSRTNATDRKFEVTDLTMILQEVMVELKETIEEKHATIEATGLCPAYIIPFQFRQLMHNLINNALKFSNEGIPPHIIIKSEIVTGGPNNKLIPGKEYCHITFTDNGIGFEPEYSERIFEVFQKLHGKDEYAGTGIGLAIVKKIVDNHNGLITATSELNKGASFDIYIPSGS